jgi:dihydrofolate reductase
MRPIVNSTFVSLDGVVNHMEKWHFNYIDAESDMIAYEQLAASDAMLMGRKTFEVYAATWPARHDRYASQINAIHKYVASTTLQSPTWDNTTVIRGGLADAVRALKEQDGKTILMHGFGPVAKSLLREGLLDELHLWYHPVFAGIGDPNDTLLTPGLNIAMQHTNTRTLASGVVLVSYRAILT